MLHPRIRIYTGKSLLKKKVKPVRHFNITYEADLQVELCEINSVLYYTINNFYSQIQRTLSALTQDNKIDRECGVVRIF